MRPRVDDRPPRTETPKRAQENYLGRQFGAVGGSVGYSRAVNADDATTSHSPWTSVTSLRAANGAEACAAFDETEPTHASTLLALSHEERVQLLGSVAGEVRQRFVEQLVTVASLWPKAGRAKHAITLLDALVESQGDDEVCALALWTVIDANTHLGVDEPRGRRYLASATPHLAASPQVRLNAIALLVELGDQDSALGLVRAAAKAQAPGIGALVHAVQTLKVFESIRGDERFIAAAFLAEP